jgi:hypothetical protein
MLDHPHEHDRFFPLGRSTHHRGTPVFVGDCGFAIQILWVFLNLRQSTPAWKATFVSFLATIFFIVWSCAGISLYWVH